MSSLTWGDIVTLVASNLGKFTDGVVDPNVASLLPRWAQSVITELMQDRNYWFLRQTGTIPISPLVQKYPLPPGYNEGMTLYLVFTTPQKSYVELDPLYTRQEIVRLFNPVVDLTDCAQPTNFMVNVQDFELWPCPDQAYTVGADFWGDMTAPSSALTTDTFQNYIITTFPRLFEDMLTFRGFRYLQESEDAIMWEKSVEKAVKDLRARHVARVLGSDFVFRPRTDVHGDFLTNRGDQWVTYMWGS